MPGLEGVVSGAAMGSAVPGIGTLIGAGVGVLGSIGKMLSRSKANKDMRGLISRNPAYQENPLAQQRLSLAQTMLNARMPGSLQAERNIYGSQANQLANVNRNAMDASQALAMGAAAQGATNDAFTNLGMQEAGDYQRRYGNLVNAQEGVINEGDKVYQDQVRRYGDETQLRGGIAANRANTWGDVSNLGFGLADFGMAGGFNNAIKQKPLSHIGMGQNGSYGYKGYLPQGLSNRTSPNYNQNNY